VSAIDIPGKASPADPPVEVFVCHSLNVYAYTDQVLWFKYVDTSSAPLGTLSVTLAENACCEGGVCPPSSLTCTSPFTQPDCDPV
jgi:hypothetical protein